MVGIIVGGVLVSVAVALLLMGGGLVPTEGVSTADPADVVLQLSDLPSGWSENSGDYQSLENWALPYSPPELAYSVMYTEETEHKYISNLALRFSSEDDANAYFDGYVIPNLITGGVPHTTIGDESTVAASGGAFRKSNFFVYISSPGDLTSSEVISYLQICENRI